MVSPRAGYARPSTVSASYILYYVLFVSLVIAASASAGAAGRVTLSLLPSLAISWMFVPVLQVLIAAALVATARSPRAGGAKAIALLLRGHAPWSLWILTAGAMLAIGGYPWLHVMELAAAVPLVLTIRVVHAFCREVLGASARGAIARTVAHQLVTWVIAAIYLDRAVSLVPRIESVFQ